MDLACEKQGRPEATRSALRDPHAGYLPDRVVVLPMPPKDRDWDTRPMDLPLYEWGPWPPRGTTLPFRPSQTHSHGESSRPVAVDPQGDEDNGRQRRQRLGQPRELRESREPPTPRCTPGSGRAQWQPPLGGSAKVQRRGFVESPPDRQVHWVPRLHHSEGLRSPSGPTCPPLRR